MNNSVLSMLGGLLNWTDDLEGGRPITRRNLRPQEVRHTPIPLRRNGLAPHLTFGTTC